MLANLSFLAFVFSIPLTAVAATKVPFAAARITIIAVVAQAFTSVPQVVVTTAGVTSIAAIEP